MVVPIGAERRQTSHHWRTLLFRPFPGSRVRHPGIGAGVDQARVAIRNFEPTAMMSKLVSPRWSVAANIVAERPYGPLGLERRSGTKHFRPGAKVWVIDWFPGTCIDIVVVGHHRGSHRFAKLALSVRFTEGWRPELVYSPTVLTMIDDHFRGSVSEIRSRENALDMCRALGAWREGLRPPPVRETAEVVAHIAGDRLRIVPLRSELDGAPDRSRSWDVPAILFPPHLAQVGARVLVHRNADGELTIRDCGSEEEAP